MKLKIMNREEAKNHLQKLWMAWSAIFLFTVVLRAFVPEMAVSALMYAISAGSAWSLILYTALRWKLSKNKRGFTA